MQITPEIFRAISATNKRLVLLRRWSSTQTDNQYDELAKQALNAIITFILASSEEGMVKEGKSDKKEINWDNFPLISLYRCFQKGWLLSDVSEKTFEKICEIGGLNQTNQDSLRKWLDSDTSAKTFEEFRRVSGMDEQTVDTVVVDLICKMVGSEFTKRICKAWESPEKRIFQAASKIATYIEGCMLPNIGPEKVHELLNEVQEFYDIPTVKEISNPNSNIFKILQDIANLRHQNRWVTFLKGLDCSVLGHLLDTALYAYLMGLEEDPKNAAKLFFLGIFHDIPEGWTKDIPSTVKDSIKGFREASEKFEREMVEKHIYDVVSEYLAQKIKDVMMEEGQNDSFKRIMKGADYLSASVECLLALVGGSREGKWITAMNDLSYKASNGVAYITPTAWEFYDQVLAEGEKMKNGSGLSFFFEP